MATLLTTFIATLQSVFRTRAALPLTAHLPLAKDTPYPQPVQPPKRDGSLRSLRSAVFTTATSGPQPDLPTFHPGPLRGQVRLDLRRLENRAAVLSPAADPGCKRRSKTGSPQSRSRLAVCLRAAIRLRRRKS